MVSEFTIESVREVDEYLYYGQTLIKYELTLDTGEVVFYNRSKGSVPPGVGDIIHGTIAPNSEGEPTLKITRRKSPKATNIESKNDIDIRGTQLFQMFVDKQPEDLQRDIFREPEMFVKHFKYFQEVLGEKLSDRMRETVQRVYEG